jgi:TM2 domain-containing membrane protein YozV
MNIDSAKKKLADGRLALAKAGNDPDLLGLALTKIHSALEDACRAWLSVTEVARHHQLDVQSRARVSWKEIFELMPRYYQWSAKEVEYVRRLNGLRNQAAHREGFQGTRQDLEDYASYVENLLAREQQPTAENRASTNGWSSRNTSATASYSTSSGSGRQAVARPERQPEKANLVLAYLLWGLGLFGFCGIHRFYLGRPITGGVWLFSYGFFFLAQLLDLFLIPSMAKGNTSGFWQRLRKNGLPAVAIDVVQQVLDKLDRFDRRISQNLLGGKPDSNAMKKLLEAAEANGKVLSLGQAVMATGLQPSEVEELFNEALRKGLAHVGNDPESGAVRYYFDI